MSRFRETPGELDLERDLVTTAKDVEALRENRAIRPFSDLTGIEQLNVTSIFVNEKRLRRVFPDQPSFEL